MCIYIWFQDNTTTTDIQLAIVKNSTVTESPNEAKDNEQNLSQPETSFIDDDTNCGDNIFHFDKPLNKECEFITGTDGIPPQLFVEDNAIELFEPFDDCTEIENPLYYYYHNEMVSNGVSEDLNECDGCEFYE